MNNNNSRVVKIGYYIIFLIIFILIIIIIVLLYFFIYKKNIGDAFDTHLQNVLTDENLLINHTTGSNNYIKPSFIQIYIKNIEDEKEILEDYKKYIVNIGNFDIYGLKALAFALFILGFSLKTQESIELYTGKLGNSFNNINIIILLIIIIGLFSIIMSVYLLIKFMKMKKILSINEESIDNEKILTQGLLYEPIITILDLENNQINNNLDNIKKILKEFKDNKGQNFNFIHIDENNAETNFNIDELTVDNIKKFYEDNKNFNLPTPLNGGNNKYEEIYKKTAKLGFLISCGSLLISIISIFIIYKRAD